MSEITLPPSRPTPLTGAVEPPPRRLHWHSGQPWLREPLLHFVVLGGLLFGADHFLIARADDPHTIVLSAADDLQARQLFKASRGHDPDAAEVAAMRRVWLDNEVLYREGLALQVDKGDTAIRDRVIFKALNIVDAGTQLPEVNDQVLRRWFEAHRDKYDEPTRYDFEEGVLSGDSTESAVRALALELNAGKTGEAKAGLRVFNGRPRANLVQSYGAEFANTLDSASKGEWQALKTPSGWRVVRLNAISPGKPADYAALRPVVQQDWTDATLSEQRSAAVQALAKKYRIRIEAQAS